MNRIKKIGFLCLTSACFLVSCNKTYDANGVKEFINKNYSIEKAKTLSDMTVSIDASNISGNDKTKVEESIVKELTDFATYYGLKYEPRDKDGKVITKIKSNNDNPVSKNSMGFKESEAVTSKTITSAIIDGYESTKSENSKINYVTCNNELSVSGKIIDTSVSGGNPTSNFTDIYNDVGQIRYTYKTLEAKTDEVSIKVVSIFNFSYEG